MGKNKAANANASKANKAVEPQEIEAAPGFFGYTIKPGQALVWSNELEELAVQLTSAALGPQVVAGRSTLIAEVKDSKVALCTLVPEKAEQWNLAHLFTPYDGPVVFRIEGVNEIHLTGMIDVQDDEDEHDHDHHHGHDHDDDDDDDSDDAMIGTYSDSESDGSDVMIFGGDDDDDDDEEDDEGRIEILEERLHGDLGEKKKKEAEAKKEAKKEEPKKEIKKEKDQKPADVNSKKRPATAESVESPKKAKTTRVHKGVTIEETAIGKGQPVARGKKVSILYKGRLQNGKQFDAQQNRKTPFVFRHGIGDVIKGMDIGIEGMRSGGKRTITIPGHLGYGKAGSPPVIPPNATLIFEIEVL